MAFKQTIEYVGLYKVAWETLYNETAGSFVMLLNLTLNQANGNIIRNNVPTVQVFLGTIAYGCFLFDFFSDECPGAYVHKVVFFCKLFCLSAFPRSGRAKQHDVQPRLGKSLLYGFAQASKHIFNAAYSVNLNVFVLLLVKLNDGDGFFFVFLKSVKDDFLLVIGAILFLCPFEHTAHKLFAGYFQAEHGCKLGVYF